MTHSVRWQLGKALVARFARVTKTLKRLGLDDLRSADGNVTAASSPRPPNGDVDQPSVVLDKPSLAVLPFQNMSGDPEQEYFADGIVEEKQWHGALAAGPEPLSANPISQSSTSRAVRAKPI
jgi:adenylate cyclase